MGETSTQIKNRVLAANPQLHGMPTAIWAGRNDISDPATVKANIASMVGVLATSNYVVLSIPPSSTFDEQSGGANKARLDTLNSDLATLYGAKFIDVKALLQAHGNGGAQDNADISADLIPSSLRQDSLHLNAAGSAYVAAEVKSKLSLP